MNHEIREKLDMIERAVARMREDVSKLERAKRAPPQTAVNCITAMCLQVTVGALEVQRDLTQARRE